MNFQINDLINRAIFKKYMRKDKKKIFHAIENVISAKNEENFHFFLNLMIEFLLKGTPFFTFIN